MERHGPASSSLHMDGALQHVLKLAYSESEEDQQKAAMDLCRVVEGTAAFPAFSFGPVSHALCRLVPSRNRTVSSYAARALKLLVLDDALRPQVIVAGVPAIVSTALKQWEDEVLCLRELMGCMQTLCWDRTCVKAVLQTGIASHLIDYIQCSDVEVSTLALATLANILSFSNTLLLTDAVTVEVLASAMPKILDVLRGGAAAGATGSVGGLDLGIAGSGGGAGMGNISSAGLSFIGAAGLGSGQQQRAQRFYAAAGVANAAAHPRLAEVLKQHGGLPLMKELQHQSQRNLHLLGSKMGDCASVAVARLSQGGEAASVPSGALGAPGGISKYTPGTASNLQKFSFKWGTKPTMELSLDSMSPQKMSALWVCFAVWLVIIFFAFFPSVSSAP